MRLFQSRKDSERYVRTDRASLGRFRKFSKGDSAVEELHDKGSGQVWLETPNKGWAQLGTGAGRKLLCPSLVCM